MLEGEPSVAFSCRRLQAAAAGSVALCACVRAWRGEGRTRMDTELAASISRRSMIFCDVTMLPVARPRGEELGLNTMASVGGSMGPASSRSASAAPATVSPMPGPLRPATDTMSPAPASPSTVHPPPPFRF